MIFDQQDVCDLVMQGRDITAMDNMLVDSTVDLEQAINYLETIPKFVSYTGLKSDQTLITWDLENQNNWHMPDHYKNLDIAEYVLGLCTSEAELQRCGEELLLFQERDLFNLLRYLKYLVDVMIENKVIWGVGRGSSVASYVLYKLGVHRIDSMFYNLDVREFLR